MGARFIAYLEQASEGCDYTIGCGVLLIPIGGNTREEAVAELKQMIFEDGSGYGPHSDYRLERITLYEVADTAGIPIKEWYAEHEAEQKRAALEQASAAERAQYDRLRQKYG
jgi:hypothetical protein